MGPPPADAGSAPALWLGAMAALGLMLLLFGSRILLPVVAIAGGTVGWMLGDGLREALVPEWPPPICAAVSAVIAAGIAALFLRPALVLIAAAGGAAAALLVAGALIERGIVPTGRAPYGSAPTQAVDPLAARGVGAARSAALDSIERALADPPAGASGGQDGDAGRASAAGGQYGSAVRYAGIGMRVWGEIARAWSEVPTQARTLLSAAAAAGGAAGLVVGMLFGAWTAAGVSSMLGSALLVGAGFPLAERISHGTVTAPGTAGAWLLSLAAVWVAGWAFQAWRAQSASRAAPSGEPSGS